MLQYFILDLGGIIMKKGLAALIFASLLIIVAGCSSANTSNSKGENDNNEPEIVNLIIEKIDESNFYVVSTAEGNKLEYAYYVLKDNDVIEKFSYEKNAHFSYDAKESGVYKVRSYVKDVNGNIVRQDTEEIEINL